MTPTLDSLEIGARAVVEGLASSCDRAGRMAALGFVPGQPVRVTRLAPLGDPISVEIDGREISLRRAEAALVRIVRPRP